MGICLDTDQQDGSQVFEEAGAQNSERWRREAGILATPPGGKLRMRNNGPITFEQPMFPVIFVLGGPGSGKVTHCDRLMMERRDIHHINMTDLLQQYSMGNDMQDFSLLSSKDMTQVLMMEMKMCPGAKTYLVSGYPRNMRDVVEYSERIQIVNGVVLIAWNQEMLERQIDYGVELGHIMKDLAKMEIQNFYRNVMPVAEYFDSSGILIQVNGERAPNEVYVDFRQAVMNILGFTDDSLPPRQPNSMETEVEVVRDQNGIETSPLRDDRTQRSFNPPQPPPTPPPPPLSPSPPPVIGEEIIPLATTNSTPRKRLPPTVWVVAGPGSNKSQVCKLAVKAMPKWTVLSTSEMLVDMSASSPAVKEAVLTGDFVPNEYVMLLVEKGILQHRNSEGIILDGFPRNLKQAREFENKFGQRPNVLLLDVSRLEPKRGKVFDNQQAFKRRLDAFRDTTIPMLNVMGDEGRLMMVHADGGERTANRQKFAEALLELMRRAAREEDDPNRISSLDEDELAEQPQLQANGVAKPVANGLAHRATTNSPVAVGNGVAGGRKLANGSVQASKKPNSRAGGQMNGQQQRTKPGASGRPKLNGAPPTQNGVSLRGQNGNRVAPERQANGISTLHDPLRRMYNEIDEQPPTSVHI